MAKKKNFLYKLERKKKKKKFEKIFDKMTGKK